MRTISTKHFIIAAALLLAATASASDNRHADDYEYGSFQHMGAELGIGTQGFTLGLATAITPFFELGANVNYMPAIHIGGNMSFKNSTITIPSPDGMGINTYKLDKMKVEGDFHRLTFDAKLYLYPFGPGTTFFVAGGVSVGGERLAKLKGHSDEVKQIYDDYSGHIEQYEDEIKAVVGKTALSMAANGNVSAEIRLRNVRPYVGVGFGRVVTRNYTGVRLEAGVQFCGKLKVYQDGNEVPYQDYLERADNQLAKLVDRMNFYPVLKLTINCRLF